ncbi:MAG: GNAT family N-acetyltransferase [Pseudomonadota bacterium]
MTDVAIAVRPMQVDDVPVLAEILNTIIRVGGTTAYQSAYSPSAFEIKFLRDPALIASSVADDLNSEPAGFQCLWRMSEPPATQRDGAWGDIATFARIAPKVPGLGRALFTATHAAAANAGLIAINATIRADNSGGLGYYERMGFTTYGTTHDVPLADGTPVDRIAKRFDLA